MQNFQVGLPGQAGPAGPGQAVWSAGPERPDPVAQAERPGIPAGSATAAGPGWDQASQIGW